MPFFEKQFNFRNRASVFDFFDPVEVPSVLFNTLVDTHFEFLENFESNLVEFQRDEGSILNIDDKLINQGRYFAHVEEVSQGETHIPKCFFDLAVFLPLLEATDVNQCNPIFTLQSGEVSEE